MMSTFYATFRRGQPIAVHYVKLEAHDWYSACEILSIMYPLGWDCCFTEEERHMLGDRTEMKWGLTNIEVAGL